MIKNFLLQKKNMISFVYIIVLALSYFTMVFYGKPPYIDIFIYSVIAIFSCKFDLFSNNKFWLFRSFKNSVLNAVNWGLQIFNYVQLLAYSSPILSKVRHIIPIIIDGKNLSIVGLLLGIGLTIIIWYPLFFSVTYKKSNNILSAIIYAIAGLFFYINFFLVGTEIVISQLGNMPDIFTKEIWISVFLVVIPFVYFNYFNAGFTLPSWSMSISKFSLKNIIQTSIFLIVIFVIDSAVWLHPIKDWHFDLSMLWFSIRSGVGEEFICRLFIMIIALYTLRKWKNGMWIGIIFQAVIFGLFHLMNLDFLSGSGEATTSVIASTIDAAGIGVFFAVLYLVTNSITYPIFIHIVWDLLQLIITGSGNMSLQGISGFIVVLVVATLSIIFSYYLYRTNKNKMIDNTHILLNSLE